jgi:hypothetical protein
VTTITKVVPMAVMMRVAALGGTTELPVETPSATETAVLADTGSDDSVTRFALGAALSSVIAGLIVLMSARRRTS